MALEVDDWRRRDMEERFEVRTESRLDAALDADPDAVIVCSPTSLHLDHAMAAARAGCHLFIEKPLSHTLDGIDDLANEVRSRDLVALVACNYRFDPGLKHIKSLLDEGALGTVVSARAQFGQYLPDSRPQQDYRKIYSGRADLGGGVAIDRVHEIDYMRWLLGEIHEVTAFAGHQSHLEIDTEDTVEMLVRFASGALGSIHLDYVRRTYDCSLEIVGDAGTARWCYQDGKVEWYLARDARWHSLRWPSHDVNDMYVAEIRHFLRVLDGTEKPEVDIDEARRSLAIALSAKDSGGKATL
jgi:predicted dehydrogenase